MNWIRRIHFNVSQSRDPGLWRWRSILKHLNILTASSWITSNQNYCRKCYSHHKKHCWSQMLHLDFESYQDFPGWVLRRQMLTKYFHFNEATSSKEKQGSFGQHQSESRLTALPGSRAAHKAAKGCWKTGNPRCLLLPALDLHELTNASELEHWVTPSGAPRSWILTDDWKDWLHYPTICLDGIKS